MFRRRPGRVKGFSYCGYQRYFLTICTEHRRRAFCDAHLVAAVLDALRAILRDEHFALLAYCCMPDHVHLLLEGLGPDSDLLRVIPRWKQVSGYRHRAATGLPLWQAGYYDRVLRDEEAGKVVARYILTNPVRAGLAAVIGEYPYAGSDVWPLAELLSEMQGQA